MLTDLLIVAVPSLVLILAVAAGLDVTDYGLLAEYEELEKEATND